MKANKRNGINKVSKSICGLVVALALFTAPAAKAQGLGGLFGGAGNGGGGGPLSSFMEAMMMMMMMRGGGMGGLGGMGGGMGGLGGMGGGMGGLGGMGGGVPQSNLEREQAIRDEAARLNLEQKIKELEAKMADMKKKK